MIYDLLSCILKIHLLWFSEFLSRISCFFKILSRFKIYFSFIYYYLSVLKSTILTSTDTGFRLVSGLVSNVHWHGGLVSSPTSPLHPLTRGFRLAADRNIEGEDNTSARAFRHRTSSADSFCHTVSVSSLCALAALLGLCRNALAMVLSESRFVAAEPATRHWRGLQHDIS